MQYDEYTSSSFDPGTSLAGQNSARMLPSNLEGDFIGMSDDEKRAKLSQYNSYLSVSVPQTARATFPVLNSSQLSVTPQFPTNYSIDKMRLNPFPPEFGRETEEAVQAQQYYNPFCIPPPGFSINPPVSTISGNTSVSVPDGSGFAKYPIPDVSSLGYDRNAGYRFDPTTGLHYDANTGHFLNSGLGVFLRWDPILNTYLRVDGPGLGAPSGSHSRNLDPPICPDVHQVPGEPSNLRPPQDEFMNEIWDRMRLMAKEVIGDVKQVRNTESSSDDTSSSSSASPNRSYRKDRNRRVSRSRSPSGTYSKKSRRNRSRSVSRDRYPSSRSRRSRSRARRSRSRSPQKRRNWSRSHSREKRSRSRSPGRNMNKYRSSSGRPRRSRSRSGRSNSKGHRRKRSASPSPSRRGRHRKSSRNPSVKKKRRRHSKAKKLKLTDHHSQASTSKRRHLDSEKDSSSEPNKSRDEVTQNDSDLSEFEFLKDALDDENQSVGEYEECLDYDYIPESKSPGPIGDTSEFDYGDPLSSFNNAIKHKHIIVAPVPYSQRSALMKQLRNLESANVVRAYTVNHSSVGVPFPFIFTSFKTAEDASQWYNSQGGSVIMSGLNGARMKAYLHFSKNRRWYCKSCQAQNFAMRVLCHRCYQHKNPSGFSPVSISEKPTKWVGMPVVRDFTTESVLQRLPPLHDFDILSTQMVKEPSGIPWGICVFEVQSVEEGKRLRAFLNEQSKCCVYVIVNEKPVKRAAPGKSSENGGVGNVAGSNDRTSKCPPETGKVGDHLASLFVDKPTNTLLIYIKFSRKSRARKSELKEAENFFQGQLKDDGVANSEVSFHVDRNVGAPCCYGLIGFPDAETAAEWRAKRGPAFSINVACRKSVLELATLHFSEKNWLCPSCDLSNFPLRSLCHRCFDHKDGKSGPISLSMITTKWVATSNVPCWFREDEDIIAELKKWLNDFRFARIDILRDPDFPKLPQGCVLETGSWGESLRLRELFQRTGRFAVFATKTTEFARYTSSCQPDEDIDHKNLMQKTTEIDTVCESAMQKTTEIDPVCESAMQKTTEIDPVCESAVQKTTEIDPVAESVPVTESPSLTIGVPILPDAIQEFTPNRPAKEYLSWWNPKSTKYSDILFHLFVENPLTRVTDGRVVFVGPLPTSVRFKTLHKMIRSQLELNKIKFNPIISTSVSVQVGAPCNYALVTCETPQDAEACISKFPDGLILQSEKDQTTSILACKTYVYLSKPNWTCRNCPTVNFGLRSTCVSCLKNNDGTDILTLTDTPTNLICVKNFPKRFASEELMRKSYKHLTLLSRCTLKIPKEKSVVPLGVSVLEMGNSDDARLLSSQLAGAKLRHFLCYGVWGKSNGESEEPGNQVVSKEEPCDSSDDMGAEKVYDEKEENPNQ